MDITSLALISWKRKVTRPPELRLIVSFPTWETKLKQLEASRYFGVKCDLCSGAKSPCGLAVTTGLKVHSDKQLPAFNGEAMLNNVSKAPNWLEMQMRPCVL